MHKNEHEIFFKNLEVESIDQKMQTNYSLLHDIACQQLFVNNTNSMKSFIFSLWYQCFFLILQYLQYLTIFEFSTNFFCLRGKIQNVTSIGTNSF